jgi:hypothetical protein
MLCAEMEQPAANSSRTVHAPTRAIRLTSERNRVPNKPADDHAEVICGENQSYNCLRHVATTKIMRGMLRQESAPITSRSWHSTSIFRKSTGRSTRY